MYKNGIGGGHNEIRIAIVSILVLMELCIKTGVLKPVIEFQDASFNPCFNGTMYKNLFYHHKLYILCLVSILVLMELCIKTILSFLIYNACSMFQSLF